MSGIEQAGLTGRELCRADRGTDEHDEDRGAMRGRLQTDVITYHLNEISYIL